MSTPGSFRVLRSLSVLLLISVAGFAQVGPDEVGRILRGRPGTSDFDYLSPIENAQGPIANPRRIVMLMDSEGLNAVAGLDGYAALKEIGYTDVLLAEALLLWSQVGHVRYLGRSAKRARRRMSSFLISCARHIRVARMLLNSRATTCCLAQGHGTRRCPEGMDRFFSSADQWSAQCQPEGAAAGYRRPARALSPVSLSSDPQWLLKTGAIN